MAGPSTVGMDLFWITGLLGNRRDTMKEKELQNSVGHWASACWVLAGSAIYVSPPGPQKDHWESPHGPMLSSQ